MIPLVIVLALIVLLDIARAAYLAYINKIETIKVLRKRIKDNNSLYAFTVATLGNNNDNTTNHIA